MRQTRTLRRRLAPAKAALTAMAATLLVLLWAPAAGADRNDNSGEDPKVTNIAQDSDGGTSLTVDQQYPSDSSANAHLMDQYGNNQNHVPPCSQPGGCRLRLRSSDGVIYRSEHVMCQINCGGGGDPGHSVGGTRPRRVVAVVGLPRPDLEACIEAGELRIMWAIPEGHWADGETWVVQAQVVQADDHDAYGRYFGGARAGLRVLGWGERSLTISATLAEGEAVSVTAEARDTKRNPADGPRARVVADPCEKDPPAEDPPDALPIPVLYSVPNCTVTGAVYVFDDWAGYAPEGEERLSDYELEWRHEGGTWAPVATTVRRTPSGTGIVFIRFSIPTPGPESYAEMRARGRGQVRQQTNGVWGEWSAWGAWSEWETYGVTCPSDPPDPPASAASTADCRLDGSGAPRWRLSWTLPAAELAPAREVRHQTEVRWRVIDRQRNATNYRSLPAASGSAVLGTVDIRPGDVVHVQMRSRSEARVKASGRWSRWSEWGQWSNWSSSATSCHLVSSLAAPSAPTVTCTGADGNPSNATIRWDPSGADGPLAQYRYEVSWFFANADVNNRVQRTVTVGPLETLSATITLGTDYDGPFDLLSIQVRASTRTRASASDTWGTWGAWSQRSSDRPNMPQPSGTALCAVIVAS